MEQAIIPSNNSAKWAEALKGLSYAYGHTNEYCCAMEQASGLRTFLNVIRENDSIAVCPLSIREKEDGFRDLVSPYGFAGIASNYPAEQSDDLSRKWMTFLKESGFVTAYIMQHPLFSLNGSLWQSILAQHHVFHVVDLTQTLDDLWKRMRDSHRYELNKMAKNNEVSVITDKLRLKDALKRLYPITLARVGASAIYQFTSSVLDQLTENKTLLVGVEEKGSIQAVSLFLYTPVVAEYFLNASTAEGRVYSRQIIWAAMRMLKEMGVKMLNLGGGVKSDDSLEHFKRRFGGQAVRGQVLKLIIDQERYNYLCGKYCAGDDKLIKYFPPYWAP